LAPTLATAIYLVFIASNQYVSEMRFAVRGATQKLLSTGAQGARFSRGVGTVIDLTNSQEALIVANYIRSPAILRDLDGELDLRAIFARPGVDFLAAFPKDEPFESLVDYWLDMVSAHVDALSGIATVAVTTFTPQDSLALANAILARSERLVEEFVNRLRVDALVRAEAELRSAAQRVAAARAAQRKFRDEHRMIDPSGTAQSLFDTIVKVRQDRIATEAELHAALSQLTDAAPKIREIRTRLRTMDEQILAIEAKLVQAEGSDPGKASEAIRAYELLTFDAKMADDFLGVAESALTEARTNLDRRHVYLEAYVRPALPEQADYPRPITGTLAVLGGSFMLWTIFVLLVTAVRERTD
jgi:capsular polysaccharide transport system permease protein